MKRNRLFWAVLLILMGTLFLAGNLGLISVNVWSLFWPVFLILVGIWYLWGSTRGGTEIPPEQDSIPLEGAERAKIRLKHGGGKLRVSGGAGPDVLASGSFAGGVDSRVQSTGSSLDVVLKPDRHAFPDLFLPWNWTSRTGLSWDLSLSEAVDLDLTLETGASETELYLRDLQVKNLILKTGASATSVVLPEGAGLTTVRVEAGAASVKLEVPEHTAARIEAEAGLASIEINEERFPRAGSGYQSPHYQDADHKIDLKVQTGLGSIVIR